MNAINRTVTLTIVPHKRWFTLSAGWMVIAAALMTHPVPWRWDSWQAYAPWLVRMLVLWVLVDSVWGSIWHLLVERSLWKILQLGTVPPVAPKLPYATLRSPVHHAAIWREKLRIHADGVWQPALFLLATALVLSAWLGWVMMGITALFILTALFFSREQPRALTHHAWVAVVMVFLPFVAVQRISGALTAVSLLTALAYAVIFLGLLRLNHAPTQAERWIIFGEIAAAMVLFSLRQPLGGTAILLTVVASLWLRPFSEKTYRALSQMALLGLLIAAVTIGGAG